METIEQMAVRKFPNNIKFQEYFKQKYFWLRSIKKNHKTAYKMSYHITINNLSTKK